MVTTGEPNAVLPPGQLPKNNVEIYHVDAKKGVFRLMRESTPYHPIRSGRLISPNFQDVWITGV
jgi:hypothetical protein